MTTHLIACTVCAVAALVAAAALGHGPARWRYAILLAALARFAVPTGWLERAGGRMAPILPARTNHAIEELERLLLHPGPAPGVPPAPASSRRPSVWTVFWGAGAVACLWGFARRLRIRPTAVRLPDAAEWEAFANARRRLGIARPVELRIVGDEWVPGAMGLLRPIVAVPRELSRELTAGELEGVLAHELAHVVRHDNLAAALARMIVALFWFHPIVFWLERRMLAEREAACDELVVARGAHPETYLSGILKVCRMSFSGAAGYAGANGSSLETRMERIMHLPRASRREGATAAALVALVMLYPLGGGYLRAQSERQSGDQVQARNLIDQGKALLEQKDYDEALAAFRRAYQLNPEDVHGLMGEAEVEMALGRTDEAVALLSDEASRRPQRQDLQMALGNTAVRAGRYELAINVFHKLLAGLAPGASADVYLRLGETYRRMGNSGQALDALRQSVALKPDSTVAHSTLALVLDSSGQVSEAEQEYRQVLRMDSNNGVARNNLAYLLAAHGGNLDEALRLARDAQLFLPLMAEVSDTLGYVYVARGEADEAFAAFRAAVLDDPAKREIRNHLGDVLQKMSHPPGNAAALAVALKAEATLANQDLVKSLLK